MPALGVIQSAYIPWKGYFDLIDSVDVFVMYDDVAYAKHGWRNRNRVCVPDGTLWLTIPVATKGRFGQRVDQVKIADPRWADKHLRSLQTYYARAGGFDEVFPWLSGLYARAAEFRRLSQVNELFLREICEVLGISTVLKSVSEFELSSDRQQRLIELCHLNGCTEYLSGPAARSYIDEHRFEVAGIQVRWMDYRGYPEYRQLTKGPFLHEVSILDLLLNQGFAGARRKFRRVSSP